MIEMLVRDGQVSSPLCGHSSSCCFPLLQSLHLFVVVFSEPSLPWNLHSNLVVIWFSGWSQHKSHTVSSQTKPLSFFFLE